METIKFPEFYLRDIYGTNVGFWRTLFTPLHQFLQRSQLTRGDNMNIAIRQIPDLTRDPKSIRFFACALPVENTLYFPGNGYRKGRHDLDREKTNNFFKIMLIRFIETGSFLTVDIQHTKHFIIPHQGYNDFRLR